MTQVLALVEGQTEELFVKRVLGPYLSERGVWLTPTTITNKITFQGDRFKGGVSRYEKIRTDLSLIARNQGYSVITSMFDVYRLPSDFPGLEEVGSRLARDRARYLEDAWYAHAGIERFIPYLQLHEFEALVFAAEEAAVEVLTDLDDRHLFARVNGEFETPEHINHRPELAPSRRLAAACASYQKRLHGVEIVARNGIDSLLQRCPHFGDWVERLVEFG